MRMRYVVLGMGLSALLCSGPGCRRGPEIVYVRAAPKKLSYVLNTGTNTIEGIMIVPQDPGMQNELVPVLALPRRLYEKKTWTGEEYSCTTSSRS